MIKIFDREGRQEHKEGIIFAASASFAVFLMLFLIACSGEVATAVPNASNPATPLALPEGYTSEVVVTGLSRPTQFVWGPDGRLWLAQLFEGESDKAGQVVAVDLATGAQEVLLDSLNKPTGIAVLDGALWIAEESQLLRAELDDDLKPQTPEVILRDMPNNGRSNGTLSVSPEGQLIYETSGRRSGNQAGTGSGMLWALDPDQPDNPSVLATGLKNAYAHVFDKSGRLWITEIGDGTVSGANFEGQPPEEINLVITEANYGWPQCFGNQEPALNREGTPEMCAETEPPIALFPPQSTPTSIAVAPWDESVLLVALWLGGEVTAVQIQQEADGRIAGTNTTFLTGIANPQHLLPTPDGALLVSDYRTGFIYRIVSVSR